MVALRAQRMAKETRRRFLPFWMRLLLPLGFGLPRKIRPLSAECPDIWPGQEDRANALFQGRYGFGDETIVSLRQAPWAHPDFNPSNAWARDFHSFGWIRDFRAAEKARAAIDAAARRQARALVAAWIDHYAQEKTHPNGPYAPAWEDDVMAMRLRHLALHAPWLLDGADHSFLRALIACLNRHGREAVLRLAAGRGPYAELVLRSALMIFAVTHAGFETRWPKLLQTLERRAARLVAPDGLPPTRRADDALRLLDWFLQIRAALRARLLDNGEALTQSMDPIAPALRSLRHGNGRLVHLAGSLDAPVGQLEFLLSRLSDIQARPMPSLPYAGFERAQARRALLLFDAGTPSPDNPRGLLAFEFSHGKDHLVMNCGLPRHEDMHPNASLWRSSATQSTLTLAGRSPHPATPAFRREDQDGECLMEARHEGYEFLGAAHRRRLYLRASGDELRGEDSVESLDAEHPAAAMPFEIRFHLDPAVEASATQDHTGAWLKTASGQGWRFRQLGGRTSVEETVVFDAHGHAKRAWQIIVQGETNAQGQAQVRWIFQRQTAARAP